MDVRVGDESTDENEKALFALLPHQRQIVLHALRRRRLVEKRTSRRLRGSRIGKKRIKQRHFAKALHRIRRQ